MVRQEEYNEQFPEGTVYLVQPEPGSSVKVGGSVQVWVSKGARTVLVPDVQGKSEDVARQQLVEAGLQIRNVETKAHLTAPAGTVLSQSIQPRERVPRDTPVDLQVSSGPPIPEPLAGDRERGFELVVPVQGEPGWRRRLSGSWNTSGCRSVETTRGGHQDTVPIGP